MRLLCRIDTFIFLLYLGTFYRKGERMTPREAWEVACKFYPKGVLW